MLKSSFLLSVLLIVDTTIADDKSPSPKMITNTIGMELVLIPAGEFMMGSSDADARPEEKPQHRVRISKPFYLGKTEITQGEWKRVMGTTPWKGKSFAREGANYPATFISWSEAVEYCPKLSEKDGKQYRLPTEAEWEYACRAKTMSPYSFGCDQNSISDYAWWGGLQGDGNAKTEQYAHEVGMKKPNQWGLFDMHGNVSEWCSDWYGENNYKESLSIDPKGPDRGSFRVIRSGGWDAVPEICRSSHRTWNPPSSRNVILGFRIATDADISSTDDIVGDEKSSLPKTATNSLCMELILIHAGEFMMGSLEGDASDYEKPHHQVQISKPFYMGKTEITRSEWKRIMKTTPWQDASDVPQSLLYPATDVSWYDAVEFCRKLSEKEGRLYRLPTEAEWEYACRAGTSTKFSFGNNSDLLSDYAWWGGLQGNGNAKKELYGHEVGQKKPNPWGHYDMHGNVAEWCRDFYSPEYYRTSPIADPKGPKIEELFGSIRVFRGGTWMHDVVNCRSTQRGGMSATDECNFIGFRIVLEADDIK